MKNDLITRQEAIDTIGKVPTYDDGMVFEALSHAQRDVALLPSTQPGRKRGQWNITDAYPHNVYCSECYTRFAQTHWAVWEDGSLPRNFCPNCGADMREDEQE